MRWVTLCSLASSSATTSAIRPSSMPPPPPAASSTMATVRTRSFACGDAGGGRVEEGGALSGGSEFPNTGAVRQAKMGAASDAGSIAAGIGGASLSRPRVIGRVTSPSQATSNAMPPMAAARQAASQKSPAASASLMR